MTDAPAPFVRYIGDDWSFPYTYQNPDGSPVVLTGATPSAKLFANGIVEPVFEMTDAPAVTVLDAAAGKVVFAVDRDLTATLRADGNSRGYPTRIQVQLLDTAGKLTTYALDPVPVDDPRFAPIG